MNHFSRDFLLRGNCSYYVLGVIVGPSLGIKVSAHEYDNLLLIKSYHATLQTLCIPVATFLLPRYGATNSTSRS